MRALTRTDPTTSRPTVGVWAVLGVLAVVLVSISIPVNADVYGVPLVSSFIIGLAQAGLIPLALLPAWSRDSEGAPWPVAVTTLIMQTAVIVVTAFMSTWRVAILSWLIAAVTVTVVIATTPERFDNFGFSLASAIPFAAVSGGLLAIALLLAQRGRIRAQLDRERRVSVAEQGRREVMEERARIARELHDMVAHGMSVI